MAADMAQQPLRGGPGRSGGGRWRWRQMWDKEVLPTLRPRSSWGPGAGVGRHRRGGRAGEWARMAASCGCPGAREGGCKGTRKWVNNSRKERGRGAQNRRIRDGNHGHSNPPPLPFPFSLPPCARDGYWFKVCGGLQLAAQSSPSPDPSPPINNSTPTHLSSLSPASTHTHPPPPTPTRSRAVIQSCTNLRSSE